MPRITKRQRVRDFAGARGWQVIGEEEWQQLRAALPDVSESTVRESGLSIAQPWRGVVQHSIDDLDRSLRDLTAAYVSSPGLQRYCREQVIAAKDHARLVSQRGRVDENKRQIKAEMVEWMLVWLGDPAMFPAWAQLRRDQLNSKARSSALAFSSISSHSAAGSD
jgi:hypothetical protein